LATHVGNFVKTFLEGTCIFFWIATFFPPIVMIAIAQTRSSKVLLPCISWCYWLALGNNCYGFCHWLNSKFRIPFDQYYDSLFAIWNGTLFLVSWEITATTKPWLSLLIIDIDFMVFHKLLFLTDDPALLANFGNFYEKIEYQTHYECG
jgi:hypothetical protein